MAPLPLRLPIFGWALLASLSLPLEAQTAAVPPLALTKPSAMMLPDSVFYRHVLKQAAFLAHAAANARDGDLGADPYGTYFTEAYGLTAEQASVLRSVALDYETEWKLYRLRVHAQGVAFRRRYINSGAYKTEPPPRPDPEMGKLQQEGDEITLRARDRLAETFGEDAFRKVDLGLRQHLDTAFTRP